MRKFEVGWSERLPLF